MLQDAIELDPTQGPLGIAHTRWATHGVPSERNAHPHISRDGVAIVHNGIIENHDELREELKRSGYEFSSETDTEVIAHRIHYHLQKTADLFKAVRATVAELEGAYALAVISQKDPERIIVARDGLPGRHRPRRGRELRRLGRRGAAAGDAQVHLPRGRRRLRDPPRQRAHLRPGRQHRAATGARKRALGRRGREGRLPALHAQGNLRAAACRGADARRACRGRQAARGGVRSGGTGRVCEDRSRAHRGVRDQLPRERGGQVFHRADLPPAVLGGDRQRVPLSQPGRAEEHAVRQRLAVGRDGGHAGRAARSEAGRATCRSSPSATCRRARWFASPSW